MSYYRECPRCGAHLDPAEICDCKKEELPGATNTEQLEVDRNTNEVNRPGSIVPGGEGRSQV